MTIPIRTINGNSQYEPGSSAGTTKAGVFPKAAQFTVVALAAARITGVKPVVVYSIMMTSMEKITPAQQRLIDRATAIDVDRGQQIECVACKTRLGYERPKGLAEKYERPFAGATAIKGPAFRVSLKLEALALGRISSDPISGHYFFILEVS